MRFERKYRIESVGYQEVLQSLMSINGAFDYAYPDRWINSVYMDSLDFMALRENLSGVSERSKYRMRWYGKNFVTINKAILEEKVKSNLLGYKNYTTLNVERASIHELEELLDINVIRDKNLFPVVMVRYCRTYLESYDHRVRVTIDQNLEYRTISNYRMDPFPIDDKVIIVEVKYDQEIESDIDDILQDIPFRLTKNSKFVEGMMGHWV